MRKCVKTRRYNINSNKIDRIYQLQYYSTCMNVRN